MKTQIIRILATVACVLGGFHVGQAQESCGGSPEGLMGCTDAGCTDCAEGFADEALCSDCNAGGLRRSLFHPHCACPRCRRWFGWVHVDYLLGWGKGRNVPAIATTSSAIDEGVLGQPTTETIYGGTAMGNGVGNGGRVDFGTWVGPNYDLGIGGRFFGFIADSDHLHAASDSSTLLAQPFFNAQLGIPDSRLIAASAPATPNQGSGTLNIDQETSAITAEAYLRMPVFEGSGVKVDVLGGYMYSRIRDNLSMVAFSQDLNGSFLQLGGVGSTRTIEDVFEAVNNFHGGSFGLQADFHRRRLTVSFLSKLAVGNMHEIVTIEGRQTNTTPAPSTNVVPSGTYALGTNFGQSTKDQIAYLPEAGLNLSYQLTPRVYVSAGYSFMYWSHVQLAGDAIDTTLNRSQFGGLPLFGPARPAFSFRDTDYWVQGINFGLGCNW